MIVHSYRPVEVHLGRWYFCRMQLFPIGEFSRWMGRPIPVHERCAKCVLDEYRELVKRTGRVLTSHCTWKNEMLVAEQPQCQLIFGALPQ